MDAMEEDQPFELEVFVASRHLYTVMLTGSDRALTLACFVGIC